MNNYKFKELNSKNKDVAIKADNIDEALEIYALMRTNTNLFKRNNKGYIEIEIITDDQNIDEYIKDKYDFEYNNEDVFEYDYDDDYVDDEDDYDDFFIDYEW